MEKMMSEIIKFYPPNSGENPDLVLEQAIGEYSSVLIIGYDLNDELDVRASLNINHADINLMVDLFKNKLLNGDYNE